MRTSVGVLIGTVLGAAAEECPTYSQRLMLLQDTNKDMAEYIKKLHSRFYYIAGVLEKATLYTGIGLSEFSDKGLPYSGVGQHVYALKGKGDMDMCYKQLIAIYREREEIYDILGKLKPRRGGDPEGSQLEAVLYASQNNNSRFYHDQDWHYDALVVRDIVLFTDQVPHEAGDAIDSIKAYNSKAYNDLTPIVPVQKVGWGSQKMYKMDAATVWVNGSYPYTEENYDTLSGLEWKRNLVGLEGKELSQWYKLVEVFGPRDFSGKIDAHDGKATDTAKPQLDCKRKDYPSWKQVAKELKKFNTGLTVIVHKTTTRTTRRLIEYCPEYPNNFFTAFNSASDRAKCVKKYWEDHLAPLGLPHYKVYFESDGEYAELILESLKEHQEVECKRLEKSRAKH